MNVRAEWPPTMPLPARRQLLSNEAWAARLAPAVDDREVIRHYTLSEDDFDVIMRKRLDASRLGYALALCLMRHPGRSLEQGEALPVQVVGYVARQLGIAPGVFDNSPERDKERRKHLAEAMRRFGYRPFDRAALKDLIGWLTPAAQVTRAAEPLIDMTIGELRRREILLPSPRILELAVHQARQRGERVIRRFASRTGNRAQSRQILLAHRQFDRLPPSRHECKPRFRIKAQRLQAMSRKMNLGT